jgi:fructosamine-3-kinase
MLGEEERKNAYNQIGHVVAELHTLNFDAFGELSQSGTTTLGSSYIDSLAERARRRIKDYARLDLFLSLLKDRASLFKEIKQPSFCHDDLHKHNILFNRERGEWRLSAILDFDSAYAGHHESDLARLDLWRGMMGPGFWEVYTDMLTVSPMYTERRPIHQLLWCLEYTSASPQHQFDTRDVLAQLGLSDF